VTVDAFTAARPRLMGIAYRLLGSWVEAEDVVGDVAERWATVDADEIRHPEGWLVTVTTRRALDVLRSARLQRVDYPGEWLPEPIATGGEPEIELERAETLTMGFLLLLERLTPIERAVFVLHDILDHPYDVVASAVGRSEQACRQAVHRARRHVTVPARRTPAERDRAEEVAMRFLTVGLGGDVDALLASLAPNIAVTSDGGGIVHAAMRTVRGPARAARFLHNLAGRAGDDVLLLPCELNAEPGVVLHVGGVWLAGVVTVDGDHVSALRFVVNPAKLEHLVARLAPMTDGRPGPWESADRFRYRRGQRVT
jgi:RNA polymerase sigma-70 factor, ECF subfamily